MAINIKRLVVIHLLIMFFYMMAIQLIAFFSNSPDMIGPGLQQMVCLILHVVIAFGIYFPGVVNKKRESLLRLLLSIAVVVIGGFLFVVVRDYIYTHYLN